MKNEISELDKLKELTDGDTDINIEPAENDEPTENDEPEQAQSGIAELLSSGIEDDDTEATDDPEEESQEGTPEAPTPHRPKATQNPIKVSLVDKGLKFVEGLNVRLCLSISGDKNPSAYTNTEDDRKEFAEELSEYLNDTGFTMSPTMAILISAIFFFGTPLFNAWGVRQEKAAKEKAEAIRQQKIQEQAEREKAEAEAAAQANPAATTICKEARERRKSFEVHATTGCYKFPANSARGQDAIKVGDAVERPSPEAQALIDKGLSNAEIRKELGYEQDGNN